jgi:hypothetical protein
MISRRVPTSLIPSTHTWTTATFLSMKMPQ